MRATPALGWGRPRAASASTGPASPPPPTWGHPHTRYASIPVRRRDAGKPPLFPSSLEWTANRYDPHAPYGAAFPIVLVRTPDAAPNEDPRERAFGFEASEVRVLSRRGRFWLLDASEVYR